MKAIVCTDKNGGILFNERRVARDRAVIYDRFGNLNGSNLFIRPCSKTLLEDTDAIETLSFDNIPEEDYCFFEDLDISDFFDLATQIVIYMWDKKYPSDFAVDPAIFKESGYTLRAVKDIAGRTHEKIRKEVWER